MECIRSVDDIDEECFVIGRARKKLNVPGGQHCRERLSLPYMWGGRDRALIGWPVYRGSPHETAIRSVECAERFESATAQCRRGDSARVRPIYSQPAQLHNAVRRAVCTAHSRSMRRPCPATPDARVQ